MRSLQLRFDFDSTAVRLRSLKSQWRNSSVPADTPINLLCPDPIGWGQYSIYGRRLSVSLFVCPVPDHKSRMEGHIKLKIGRKEAHDTGDPWPHLEVEKSSTCRGGSFGTAQLVYFTGALMSNGRLVYFNTSKLKALGGCASHHSHGAGDIRTSCLLIGRSAYVRS